MITKQNTYNLLIFLTLVSFGFFGSLSHLFTLVLIIFIFFNYKTIDKKNKVSFENIILFFALTGCFYLLLITSAFRTNLGSILYSLNPMLPIPFIGALIILNSDNDIKLSANRVSQFSQISVLFSLLVYLILIFAYPNFLSNRLSLFSGNPIPFSLAMAGVSIFCLSNWRNSLNKQRIIALFCFAIGMYFATFSSGTRGTFLSLIISTPILIFYLSNQALLALTINVAVGLLGFLLVYLSILGYFENQYLAKIGIGVETFLYSSGNDTSVALRLEMWTATLKVIADVPLFGHSITERFNAIRHHLDDSFPSFTHPHNDIFASVISGGFLAGFAALVSLNATIVAAFLSNKDKIKKLYLGIIMAIPLLITGNISTVFFNDISSAWLAFSTYVIFKMRFDAA